MRSSAKREIALRIFGALGHRFCPECGSLEVWRDAPFILASGWVCSRRRCYADFYDYLKDELDWIE